MKVARKHSKKREAMRQVIGATTTHPSANWVYETIRREYPEVEISLPTVYRNLSQLLEDGHVMSLGVIQGEERYDGNVAPHPHLICEHCGAVIDIPFHTQMLSRFKKEATPATYEIDYRKTVFYGICGTCKHRQSDGKMP